MLMQKNILFDIDDTLFPSSDFSALARRNAINAMIGMGLEHDYTEINDRLNEIIEAKGSNYQKHFDELCDALEIKEPARYVAAAVAAYHDTKTSIAPFPQMSLTLLKLKENGHSLFVATNGSSVKQWDKLIRLGLELYFDQVFVSQDLGMEKSKGFYLRILEILKASPQECVMVGDREELDIVPAKEAGLTTVRVLKGKQSHMPSTADFTIEEPSRILQIMQRL